MGDAPQDAAQAVEEHPFPLTDVDRWVLSQTDEEYQKHSWDELKDIVGMNGNNMSTLCSIYIYIYICKNLGVFSANHTHSLKPTTVSRSSSASPPTSAST